MEHTFESTTIVADNDNYDDLKSQILSGKVNEVNKPQDIRDQKDSEEKEEKSSKPQSKKFAFRKGQETVELDDDYEVEFMADKRPTKLTLKELKERAAGDIAVKNRMHALAEEKKRVQQTFKQFSDLAKTDPLAALEFISSKASEADGEFEYTKYLEKLADQAEKLGQMDEKERKAHELEKKLKRAEEDLSRKERMQNVVLRKQEMLSEYPEVGDQLFSQIVDSVLASDELMEGIEDDENLILDRVEDLIQETLTQRDIMTLVKEINPAYLQDENLIFALSDQLRLNPDLDEEDVRDILRDVIGKGKSSNSQKSRDIQTLSNKQRESTYTKDIRNQHSSPYDLLMEQLKENKNKLITTPKYQR